MSTNTVGRVIYSALSISGAIICLFIVLSLIRRLCWKSQSTSNQSKKAMQPTMRMKICSISCGIVLFTGFIMKSLIISPIFYEEIGILVINNLGNLLMDCGQALYFKYFILSIRKLYRYLFMFYVICTYLYIYIYLEQTMLRAMPYPNQSCILQRD